MFQHPDQIMTLAQINRQEMKAEIDHWHLATAVMKAQQPANKHRPNKLGALRTSISQFFHKWSQPTWEVVVKHG